MANISEHMLLMYDLKTLAEARKKAKVTCLCFDLSNRLKENYLGIEVTKENFKLILLLNQYWDALQQWIKDEAETPTLSPAQLGQIQLRANSVQKAFTPTVDPILIPTSVSAPSSPILPRAAIAPATHAAVLKTLAAAPRVRAGSESCITAVPTSSTALPPPLPRERDYTSTFGIPKLRPASLRALADTAPAAPGLSKK